jgi:hypothetical protein
MMVNAVRAATIFAHDQRQWSRWQSRARQRIASGTRATALTGSALERAVRGLANRHPEYIVMGGG